MSVFLDETHSRPTADRGPWVHQNPAEGGGKRNAASVTPNARTPPETDQFLSHPKERDHPVIWIELLPGQLAYEVQ